MLSIHPGVQDFGDEDEKNCETDEINNENMESSAFLFLTKNGKIQIIQQNTASKPCANFVE